MARAEVAAVLLALSAALVSAVGSVIRQRSAHEIVDKPVGAWELFRLSLRDTRWWLGAVAAVANYALQAAALSLGSVMLVTALQVTVLLFALPINARITHHRVTAWEWIWAALLAGAVAVIVAVGNPAADQQRAPEQAGPDFHPIKAPFIVFRPDADQRRSVREQRQLEWALGQADADRARLGIYSRKCIKRWPFGSEKRR